MFLDVSYIRHKGFCACMLRHAQGTPPWILKRGGLESTCQRLISPKLRRKHFFAIFFIFLLKNFRFLEWEVIFFWINFHFYLIFQVYENFSFVGFFHRFLFFFFFFSVFFGFQEILGGYGFFGFFWVFIFNLFQSY